MYFTSIINKLIDYKTNIINYITSTIFINDKYINTNTIQDNYPLDYMV